MEATYGEPVVLLHELLRDGRPRDESIFGLLARLESKADAKGSGHVPEPVKQALARLRAERGTIPTRYVE